MTELKGYYHIDVTDRASRTINSDRPVNQETIIREILFALAILADRLGDLVLTLKEAPRNIK